MSQERTHDNDEELRPPKHTPVLEWILGLIGLVLVTLTVGYLLFEASADTGRPPFVLLSANAVSEIDGRYQVTFTAANQGDETAAAVAVEGRLVDENGEVVEAAVGTLSYVPAQSARTGGLYFSNNPDEFTLELVATGYEDP